MSMFTIAYFTLLEAIRCRLLIALIAVVAVAFGLAEFLGELSITETRQAQASVTASLLRVFSICATCLFVISSVLRELDDKGLDLILSLPLPRHAYLFGKLTGFAGFSLCVAILAALPLFLYAPAAAVGCWMLSLFCEQVLLAAFSLLCLLAFANISLAFTSAMAFYLLSRSMEALRLLSAAPVFTTDTISQDFMNIVVNALALLLPDLHAFTRSEWLAYGVDTGAVGTVLVQTLVYLPVLLSAGLFDLYRKNL